MIILFRSIRKSTVYLTKYQKHIFANNENNVIFCNTRNKALRKMDMCIFFLTSVHINGDIVLKIAVAVVL